MPDQKPNGEREPEARHRSAADVTGAGADPVRDPAAAGKPKHGDSTSSNPMARGYAKAEEKNQAVRQALRPLQPGERPGAVTLGAIFSGIVALVFWVSLAVRLFTDTKVAGSQPDPVQLILFAGVMTAMAVGMWQVRYWAVLGFQMLLVLFLVAATAGLLTAQTLLQVIATTLLIGVVGFLFFRMIKAMARIQMPERRPHR